MSENCIFVKEDKDDHEHTKGNEGDIKTLDYDEYFDSSESHVGDATKVKVYYGLNTDSGENEIIAMFYEK